MELVELTEYLAKQLLPNIDTLKIEKLESDGDTIIQIFVPENCMSAVIGKGGKIANSIRTIVQATAYNRKMGRVRVNIDSL